MLRIGEPDGSPFHFTHFILGVVALRHCAMTMMMAARVVFACMPVVRSGFAGSRSSAMVIGLRSRVGWRFLALLGENRARENQNKCCNDLFHYVTPENRGFPRERIESHRPRKV
jgi:hypothetical protein